MASSFGGSEFGERGSGTTFPRFERSAVFSVTQIPGGTTTILQSAGRTADTLNLRARVTEDELNALLGKVDTQASLVYSGGTRTAYLAKISGVEEVLAGRDVFFATLEFVGR